MFICVHLWLKRFQRSQGKYNRSPEKHQPENKVAVLTAKDAKDAKDAKIFLRRDNSPAINGRCKMKMILKRAYAFDISQAGNCGLFSL
ncbi:MAG TPA: hypothetical protein VGI63_06895, partial [Verrucomicrobiae bacterium]